MMILKYNEGGRAMRRSRFLMVWVMCSFFWGIYSFTMAQEVSLKDYHAVIVQELNVPSGSPAPDSAGLQMAEKAVYQLKRYSEKYSLFDQIVTEKRSKEIPSGKRILIIKGEVKEYKVASVGRRIGRSFIPGGEYTGTAAFSAHYQLIDKDTGKVIYETDLRTTSTGANDTVEYAMDRNGEALAKLITKMKGK